MAVNLVAARREMAEMATVILMAGVIFGFAAGADPEGRRDGDA